jgi:tripartite-type tricarboxylate transporter receptor subunit TctC
MNISPQKFISKIGFIGMSKLKTLVILFFLFFYQYTFSQNWPEKPIKLVVPFGPGGTNDLLARIVAQALTEKLGQSVVVDNRPGAGGSVGTDYVIRSAPDGYTLMIGATSTIAVNVSAYPNRNFDPIKNLTPIVELASGPFVVFVNPNVNATNIKELIDLAKAKPGTLNFSSSGKGSSLHLSAELLKLMTKVDMVHVPYKSGGAAITALVSGEVQVYIGDMASLFQHVKSKAVRPLAVTMEKRFPLLPDLPTVSESGVPGYEASSWYGLLGPAGLPTEIINKINTDMNIIMHTSAMSERMQSLGIQASTGSSDQFAQLIKQQIPKWATVVKAAGAQED